MAWTDPTAPNLADFTLFVRGSMGIPVQVLPEGSPWIGYAFKQALAMCLCVPACQGVGYTLAVYNLGGHTLIRIAQDVGNGSTFFTEQRQRYGLLLLSAGVVQASSDETTSDTLAVPDAIANLTIGDLQYMKTPWGREYLSYAQDFGPDVVGLT